MKKSTVLMGGLCALALSSISFTFSYSQEWQEAYDWAYQYGITTQPTIEAAKLEGNITRQAFSKMIINYIENTVGVQQSTPDSCSFPDENNIIEGLRDYAIKACDYKLMGSNGLNFNPSKSITRAQFGTILSRILWGDEHDADGELYYIYHLNALKYNGIMNNISNPKTFVKRGDALVMFKRMYEKFGSNIHVTGKTISAYSADAEGIAINNSEIGSLSDSNLISDIYGYSNVIYTGTDGTKYYYDDKFLSILMDKAIEIGESDLVDYLKIEYEYFKKGLDQLSNLDDEKLLKAMGIDMNKIDPEKMTKQEKQGFIKKIKSALDIIITKNKDKNDKLVNELGKVVKNIRNDKFGLKEKYDKTKTFMETSNKFLDLYSESMFGLIELALSDEKDQNSEEGLAQAFGLLGATFMYQGTAQEYQKHIENWAVNTAELLGLKQKDLNEDTTKINNGNNVKKNEGNNTLNGVSYTGSDIKAIVEDFVKNIPVRGNKDARFTIIEYTELLCPFCKRHSSDKTINSVIEQFSGDVNSISRHYIIHGEDALKLASAMECIAELKPSVYYEAFEKAFELYPISMEGLISIATDLGVNRASLQSCIDGGKYTQSINGMMNQGSEIFGINGTPGNVIIDRKTGNYKLVAGAYPVDYFIDTINELKKM